MSRTFKLKIKIPKEFPKSQPPEIEEEELYL